MFETALIGILILMNGFFAATEMALVSVRKTRLKTLAKNGDQRASSALHIQNHPGDFFSTVQIGITLVGTAASAFGGAEIVELISPMIALIPGMAPYAEGIALAFVVVTIVYFTLVFGELVPKSLALRNAEKITLAFIGPINSLSRIIHFPMRLLTFSTNAILKLVGSTATQHPSTSPEEIELLVKQGAAEGVFHSVEERLISGIFDYAGRRVQDVMTHRTSIIAFDEKITPAEALITAKQFGYSRYPVYSEDLDHIKGYVHIKDLIWAEGKPDLNGCIRKNLFIPSGATLPEVFNTLTHNGSHMGIILDEYGGTRGLLTLEDMLEEIVGEIEDEHSPVVEQIEHKTEGEWVFAGTTPISEIGELLDIDFQPRGVYTTLAGFMLNRLGEIPKPGDKTHLQDYEFSVKEMDHLRIARIHVKRNAGRLSD